MENSPQATSEVEELRHLIDSLVVAKEGSQAEKNKLMKFNKDIQSVENDGIMSELLAEQRDFVREVGHRSREKWLEKILPNADKVFRVTHAIKFTHSGICKKDSIFVPVNSQPEDNHFVGTHSVDKTRTDDYVYSTSAYMGPDALYSLVFRGVPFRELFKQRNPSLIAALSDDTNKAKLWVERFASVGDGDIHNSSDNLARQIYFPLSNGQYHLLAPIFPASLSHSLHQFLIKSRFSESAKEARVAQGKEKQYPHGFVDHLDLAIHKIGGDKPQNVSYLNNHLKGESKLLPSLPPTWNTEPLRPPMNTSSIFGRWFGGRKVVKELTRALAKFLAATDYNNFRIRQTRANMVDNLCAEALQAAAELWELPSGWSAAPDCRLPREETLWLDPRRGENDLAFDSDYTRGDWKDQVAHRFANWLNNQLRYHRRQLPMGDAEHNEWSQVITVAMADFEKELGHE